MARIKIPRKVQRQEDQDVLHGDGIAENNLPPEEKIFPGPSVPPIRTPHDKLLNEIWCITLYFNPLHYQSRFTNFLYFQQNIQGYTDNLLVIELARSNDEFELTDQHDDSTLIQIVDDGYLWQKERLFNVAVKCLPPECNKVIWLDCDVLFTNKYWILDTSNLLESFSVVQPYRYSIRLPPEIKTAKYIDTNRFKIGFGDETKCHGDIHHFFRRQHGFRFSVRHPGYAYAFRRYLIEQFQLYDKCIAGSSDFLISQAILGDLDVDRWQEHYTEETKQHYLKWALPFCSQVGFNFNYVRRTDLLHLYHGPTKQRQYQERLVELEKLGYNHGEDLYIKDNGCYGLKNKKEEITEYMKKFYKQRKDDE